VAALRGAGAAVVVSDRDVSHIEAEARLPGDLLDRAEGLDACPLKRVSRAWKAHRQPSNRTRASRRNRINDAMDTTLVGHYHAKTALDVACWDVFGKSVDLPVCELLGGRTDIKMPVISSIYAGDPEDMR
jgi:L-alanine-DL-glutamate epimerase-like enolase superfamily enzyme